MSDYSNIGDAVTGMFYAMIGLLLLFVPLGLWKAVEIVIWLFNHLTVSVT